MHDAGAKRRARISGLTASSETARPWRLSCSTLSSRACAAAASSPKSCSRRKPWRASRSEMTTDEINIRMAREHFAAESAHDTPRTLATLADDIMYHVVASGQIVHGKEAVSKYYDVWWTAFPDVDIQVKRMITAGEYIICENVATATHLGPWLGMPPTGRKTVQHLCA